MKNGRKNDVLRKVRAEQEGDVMEARDKIFQERESEF